MAKIDMTNKSREIKITKGRKPFEGVEFSKNEKRDMLYGDLKRAHMRSKYYADQMMEAEHEKNSAKKDTMKMVNSQKKLTVNREAYNENQKEIERIIILISDLR